MPTLPGPEPERPEPGPESFRPGSEQYRQVAVSFGANAGRYDRARPSYPRAMVDRILGRRPGLRVLDVGCGTGIVARLFQAAGAQVLGIDPDERMAAQARERGLEVEVARIEDWDRAGREFDAVVAGQAWHWVEPLAGARQAAQALRPGGRLAVFWNAFRPPPGFGQAMAEVFERVLPDAPMRGGLPGPDGYARLCDRAATGIVEAGEPVKNIEQWRFDWERDYSRDEWLDAVPTFGGNNRLPADTLQDLLTGIGAAVDAIGGHFTMGYTTVVCTAIKPADAAD
jgi:SAM-dependent methyltransferase